MNTRLPILFAVLFTEALLRCASAQPAPRLILDRRSSSLELSWPGSLPKADGSVERPFFELQRSTDLRAWQPFGERLRASVTAPGQTLSVTPSDAEAAGFFRLLQIEDRPATGLGQGGAEVFGYNDAFNQELRRIGQISPEQFAAMFPNSAQYLPGISWNPTAAAYWDRFAANPDEANHGLEPGQQGWRSKDYRLSPEEFAVFTRNGFVVSEQLGGQSFAEVFYHLWHNDLPVFISCDALLQAWHRTFDAMLAEVEETYLYGSIGKMLDGMAGQLDTASAAVGEGVLKESLLDADYFLAVARSLLAGSNAPTISSVFGQDVRVLETLNDIRAERLKEVPDFMGFCRMVDFSQFKVRGHYTHSDRLGRYFQCMMWLGRIDVPVAGGPWVRCPSVERLASPRELGLAVVLWHLLNTSNQFQTWADAERTISVFVGASDSLTFGQLGGLLAGAGIRSLSDVPDLATLEGLQADIVRGDLGVQSIRSDWFEQPLSGPARFALPRTFTVMGQKFVPDSWALSQTVFSSILWEENGTTNKVERRVPGALGVAFSVLGNDQIVPELVAQMNGTFLDPGRPHARKFRDGLPYQHNLAAVRNVIDSQSSTAWDASIYMQWLGCLRALSSPTTDPNYPEAMRTRAWSMKTLNTQLASWTQLRHDTILYAKQSYTDGIQCVYPTGFVESRLEFWRRLQRMASAAADQISALRYQENPSGEGNKFTLDPAAIQERQVAHLREFAAIAARLEGLPAKQLIGACFTPNDEAFIDQLMEERTTHGCGGWTEYSGWYPKLFYRTHLSIGADRLFHENYGAGAFDALIADVHTDVPCSPCDGDPGSVLHQAVGRVNLLMLAVDIGPDRFICAGPVLSHYEFEVIGGPRRISDQEWQGQRGGWSGPRPGILDGGYPSDVPANRLEGVAPPPWTQSFLVPAR